MAQKKLSGQARINSIVQIRHAGRAFAAVLAVNPGFAAPYVMDKKRGVEVEGIEPPPLEMAQAERAVAERTLAQLIPERTLRLWIWRQQRRRGGMGGLVDALEAMKPLPAGRDKKLHRQALKRALERSGPAKAPGRKEEHKGIVKADYRDRIALLILRESQVVLSVFAYWAIVQENDRQEFYARKWTDPTMDLREAQEIIARQGQGLVDYVREVNARREHYPLIVVVLHQVLVQVDQGRPSGGFD